MYKYMHNFSDEFLANLNKKIKAYRLGTVVVCADGTQLKRVRKMFVKV